MSTLDGIRTKMASLRAEQEKTQDLNEQLHNKIKELEDTIIKQEHEMTSLSTAKARLEGDLEKLNGPVEEAKATANECTELREKTGELQRKLQKMEEEADELDNHNRTLTTKLRDSEVQKDYAIQKVQNLESAQSKQDEKYDTLREEFDKVKKELEDFQQEIGNI